MGSTKQRINEKTIRLIEPPQRGNRIVYDSDVTGFGFRVTATGAAAFVLNYFVAGRERRYTIGRYPEWSATAARERARELRRLIDAGADPLAERNRSRVEQQDRARELTFSGLAEQYLDLKAAKQRGRSEYERLLRREALPRWGSRLAREINRGDVRRLVEEKASSAPIAANRLFQVIRRLFNWAIDQEIVESNPCARLRRPAPESSKDRVLTRDELRLFWEALDGPAFSPEVAAALRLILVTAQRPGEVAAMEWADVDTDHAHGLWTIPAGKAKNAMAHRVPLNRTALDVLNRLPRASRWVFPSPKADQPINRNALAAAVRRARRREESALEVAAFTPHDLRRTAASLMASVGVEPFVVARVLNHIEPGVTKVYNRHGYDIEKRRALDIWERELQAIVAGRNSKVVEFASA